MTKLWIVNGTLAGKDEQYTLSYSWLADMFWGVCLFVCLFFKMHSDRRNGDIGKTSSIQLKQQEKIKLSIFFCSCFTSEFYFCPAEYLKIISVYLLLQLIFPDVLLGRYVYVLDKNDF